jgi:hypothetical protein
VIVGVGAVTVPALMVGGCIWPRARPIAAVVTRATATSPDRAVRVVI